MSKAWNIFLYLLFVVFTFDVAMATTDEVDAAASAHGDPSQWFYAADSDKVMVADAFKYQAEYEIDAGSFYPIGEGQGLSNYCTPRNDNQEGSLPCGSLILFEADTSPPL
ncbi:MULTISPECIES: hypothetical protein [unclassified Carboxylicivirga]|uniref:hypothetical protein n=1 Tax=Carboxylicivirga TaxID=1628153 RepID=UPI003D33D0BF